MSRLVVMLSVSLLTGCATAPVIDRLPPPPDPHCADQCYVACDAAGIAWAPPAEGDALEPLVEQVVLPLRGRLARCELSRKACVTCLDRLRQAGVVR